uniref:carbonic anhydrase n=1 Tax=Timema genevievae TaxID=629358 RepID=A0A7R9JRA9_TIMGE|nr:unnamed protein product [Timema genevievae]
MPRVLSALDLRALGSSGPLGLSAGFKHRSLGRGLIRVCLCRVDTEEQSCRFSMEAHAVHKKKGLKTMKEASECLEGIAVVSIFFQVKCKQKCAEIDCKSDKLERLVDYLPRVRRPYSKTEVPSNVLEWFMDRAKPSGYYTYPGSFSLDTSSEVVTWLVYPRPITICQNQIDIGKFVYENKTELLNVGRHAEYMWVGIEHDCLMTI